jgi:glycosyltransferase involved in cell wall biosynthesis
LKLVIQIPAYNEEATIAKTLADLPKRIDGFSRIETLVIDDGSTDGTVAAARKAGADHIVRLVSNRGLATAFVAGIDASLRLGADVIVNTDADNQYVGADIAKVVKPIVDGAAEVVIGDRDVQHSPHMGPVKKVLQKVGSWAVGLASGVDVPDATSGMRAFSRDAAYQINVFNPFTYTLETIIQAGNRNFGLQSVVVGTNPPTRPSRLYRGIASYVRKSVVTMFRVYALYKPLKTFVLIGAILFLAGAAIGGRFLWFYLTAGSTGHIQSLILAAVLLISGFQTALIGLLADLISVNRRIAEEILIRQKKMDPAGLSGRTNRDREKHHHGRRGRVEREQPPEQIETQWVWLIDEAKLDAPPGEAEPSNEPPTGPSRRRRRRRRRPGGPPQGGEGPAPIEES